jgi:hypothetical protein
MAAIAPKSHIKKNSLRRVRASFQLLGAWCLDHQEFVIVIFILLINLLLVSPTLMPELAWINPHDEAKYIDSGWRLLEGNLRDLAWGPLVAFLYAPIHLLVGHSPNWFLLEDWIGRFLLFIALWLSTLFLARQFREHVHPYLVAGVLLINLPFFLLIENQSDAVFVCMSMLGLSRVIQYSRNHKIKDIYIASLCVGLGVLARFEQILLLGILLFLALFLGRRHHTYIKILLACLLPAVAIISLYFLGSIAMNGKINFGVGAKSYLAFEDNQPLPPNVSYEDRFDYARSLFGTPEENNGSVLRAILRNPIAYGKRLIETIKQEPDYYLSFFGKKLGPPMLLFAAWGTYALIKRKKNIPLFLAILWAFPASVSLTFLPRHLIPQTCYLPLLLGSVGISFTFDNKLGRGMRLAVLGSFAFVLVIGFLGAKPAFLAGSLMIILVLCLVGLLGLSALDSDGSGIAKALLLLLAAGLILHGPYPFPNYPKLGVSREELAVHFLEEQYSSMTPVLVQVPLPAVAARMVDIDMDNVPTDIATPYDLWFWLKTEGIPVVYVDSHLRLFRYITDITNDDVSDFFDLVYTSEDGDIRIYQVRNN